MNLDHSRINFVRNYLKDVKNNIELLESSDKFIDSLINVSQVIVKALIAGNKIYIAGNGGSAADAQHFAAELVSRFLIDRNPLPAIALTTDTSCLTAIGNDYGFEHIFSRQLRALASPGDVFIGITTSGRSANVINAFNICNEKEIVSIAFSGSNGIQSFIPDHLIAVSSTSTPVIQELHLITYHMLCSIIEDQIFAAGKSS